MLRSKFRVFPSIRVHVWGGLGSQLYGVLTSLRLVRQFPSREIHLVFHSSGITRRHIEVDPAHFGAPSIKFLDDWKAADSSSLQFPQQKLISSLKNYRANIKTLLMKMGFLAMLSEDRQFAELKPWVLSVRGDYSQISLTEFEMDLVSSSLGIESQLKQTQRGQKEVIIHFRSDDLLIQKTTSYVDPKRFESILDFETIDSLVVYTDGDLRQTHQTFRETYENIEVISSSATETIRECVSSKRFIGTSSKISLWIVLLRAYHHSEISYIPKELMPALIKNLENLSKKGIFAY